MHDFKCARCGECCRRYFIVSTPEEISGQAKLKGMKMREFLDTHCQLFLQLFAHEQDSEKPTINKNLLPKKIALTLEQRLGPMPDYFVALPMVCFKRKESDTTNGKGTEGSTKTKASGACTFYTQDENGLGGCSIYGARPLECRLFPFISMKKNADYTKLYPFCHGLALKDEKLNYSDLSYVHFRKSAEYFKGIMGRGFCAVWKEWPKKGVALFEEKPLGKISEEEFMQTIGPYR